MTDFLIEGDGYIFYVISGKNSRSLLKSSTRIISWMRRSGLRFSTLEKKEEIAVSNEFEINRGIFITVITVYHTHHLQIVTETNFQFFVKINFPLAPTVLLIT